MPCPTAALPCCCPALALFCPTTAPLLPCPASLPAPALHVCLPLDIFNVLLCLASSAECTCAAVQINSPVPWPLSISALALVWSARVCLWVNGALPCPALPCPALPCPALWCTSQIMYIPWPAVAKALLKACQTHIMYTLCPAPRPKPCEAKVTCLSL